MSSKALDIKHLVLVSLGAFVIHGIEEYFSRFYAIDPQAEVIFRSLAVGDYRAGFIILQVLFWLVLLGAYFLVRANKQEALIAAALGAISLYELTHIWYGLRLGGYYPGLYTSLAFPLLAVYFFRHFIKKIY